MAKQPILLNGKMTEFSKTFQKLCRAESDWQVWGDFVEMAAISIANGFEINAKIKQDREDRYIQIIRKYAEDERPLFAELFAILVVALEENPDQDFLGELFMRLGLGNHWKGQFFTPYNLCKFMASINAERAAEDIAINGYASVNDPACGAGATLIAMRNKFSSMGFGGAQTFFVGQDIDRNAAMMCYIQLSLLGCAGYVVVADTLTHPITGPMLWPNITEHQEIWFMPSNFIEPEWVIRLNRTWRGEDAEKVEPLTKIEPKHQSDAEPIRVAVSEPTPIFGCSEDQLTLF